MTSTLNNTKTGRTKGALSRTTERLKSKSKKLKMLKEIHLLKYTHNVALVSQSNQSLLAVTSTNCQFEVGHWKST